MIIGIIVVVVVIAAIVILGLNSVNIIKGTQTTEDYDYQNDGKVVEREDVEESPESENGFFRDKSDCEGGKIIFNYPPVNLDKTELVIPLGLMTGGHVTPVDHQYFQDFNNDKADIEVYSPGAGTITNIEYMFGEYYEGNELVEWEDFRLIIEHTCTISSIYIHIDVLSEKIAGQVPEKGGYASVRIPVEAGEIIGWYKNNVDYNLVDQEVILPGLLIPEHYEREPWKVHVPDTLEYFNEEIKNKIIEKSLRFEEPIAGKFDWDVDGRLRGNWFEEGTNYYAGSGDENYWVSQISISPDYLDHDQIIVSMGRYDGGEAQFGVKGNSPDPAEVSVESGLIKYELVRYDYYTTSGEIWDRTTLAKIKEVRNYDDIRGVVLVEMIDDRRMKFEAFPGKTASEVGGFTEGVRIYER